MYGLSDPDCPVDLGKLTASISLHEGLRLLPYTDSTGNITIGYGTNISAGITNAEAAYLRDNRIQTALAAAQGEPWWDAVNGNDARARAFVECLYNLGTAGLLGFHKALDAACRGDWATCANEFRNSKWFKQVGSQPGERGFVIAQMIETGQDAE